MLIDKKFHVSYCTNIHPGQDWNSTFQSLKDYVPSIKKEVSPDLSFGLGLRLSNKASEELDEGSAMTDFKEWLKANDIYIFTMNGFPYGNFHDERVKDDVHSPDWTTNDRLVYTKRLFRQLASLIPFGLNGGISTSPVSYKYWHKTDEDKHKAFKKGAEHMVLVAQQLFELEKSTGTYLHLDIEPEPDGLLENSDEVLSFYKEYLVPAGEVLLQNQLGLNSKEIEKLVKRYITVCYDICHFSLAYEEPEDTFAKFKNSNIVVGKIQVSAALKILFNASNSNDIWHILEKFNEPTYLHQVTEKVGALVKTYNDLPVVLDQKGDFEELRAHFHVPIFLEEFGALHSTQDHILKTLQYLKTDPISEHLEIETYTWDVLPKDLKEDLTVSIIREIKWLKDRM
ncbi:metabolite traffic protein EboE [Maribacter sp. MMG018]|uniref:metabolite traffic protein EboE n=1 Tax=Maribacter sp. MMG018 TaxID=2822688 RepID=UPI001B379AEB|nr:metabolite traffic protein EboE [Maribacter sp. MMG018]MBQ4914536.1 metabolite traffic protein EboE [Maribacter sp. MMG018]